MAVFQEQRPYVIPASGGSISIDVEADGGYDKDGKQASWTNVRTTSSWLTIVLDETNADAGDYWATFYITATKNSGISRRTGYCYVDYALEDGTTGSATIYVYQNGTNGITTTASNPLVFDSSTNDIKSPDIIYSGITSMSAITTPVVTTGFYCSAVIGGAVGNSYSEEYEIYPLKYNVTADDVIGSIKFSYINPSTSVVNEYWQYLRQSYCPYPFGLRGVNYEIVEETNLGNKYRRIRGIPFTGGNVKISCYFPYFNGTPKIELDVVDWADISVAGGLIDGFDGMEETYTVKFNESTNTSVRSVYLKITYSTKDGVSHTDQVQLIQDASDGSNINPEVAANVEVQKFKSDGTPELYGYTRVRYIGDIARLSPEVYDDWISIGSPVLIESNGSYNRLYEYPIVVQPNYTASARSTVVRYIAEDASNPNILYGDEVEYIQAKTVEEYEPEPEIPVEGDDYIGPIWKDVEYNFGGAEQVEYGIYEVSDLGYETLVFSGRSLKRPNAVSNTVLINKICQNYMLVPELMKDAISVGGGYSTFKLKSADGNTTYRTFRFVGDWSYSPSFKTGVLSHPIVDDRTVVYGQLLPFSVFGAAERVEVPYGIRYKEDFEDEYGEPIDDWSSIIYAKNEVVTDIFPIEERNYESGVIGYFIGDVEYSIVDSCNCDWVIYYVNPWGGYDWFKVVNKLTVTDNLTQHTYVQNYNNTTYGFGKRRYLSEINRNYQITTQWLNQDESDRMWYLLESNTVYLHNIRENKIIPVIVKDTTVEHKQKNRSQKIIQYTFTLEESQTRERI